jgi:hypothetical protein
MRRRYIVLELVQGIVTFTCAWNIPRYLINRETTIATQTPPYQMVSDGQVVVLDMSLSQPLIDPPTIPLNFSFGHLLPVLIVCSFPYLSHFEQKEMEIRSRSQKQTRFI